MSKQEDLLKLEQALITISARFVSFSSFSDVITTVISEIGRILDVDWIFLELFYERKAWLPNTYEWRGQSIEATLNFWGSIPKEKLCWLFQCLESEGYIWIQNCNNLPTEATAERELLKRQNIHSFLGLPLRIGQEIVGILSIGGMQGVTTLPEEVLCFLQVCAEIMSAALNRELINHELGERVKELNCLYGISEIIQKPEMTLKEVLQETAGLLPPAWQYPEIATGCILFEGKEFSTPGFRYGTWTQSADIFVYGEKKGSLMVSYSEKRPDAIEGEGPFLKEERRLLEAVAERLGRIIERKQAGKALRESELTFREIFEAIPDLAFLWRQESDGKIILAHVNTAALENTGGKIMDFIKTDLKDFYKRTPDLVSTVRHVMETSEIYQGNYSCYFGPFGDGRKICINCIKAGESAVLMIAKDCS
ncbi:MAG: GAF domain-containing protein [Candidatus Hodarchaeota archaeon]